MKLTKNKSKMKVAVITPSAFHLYNLATLLKNENLDITLITYFNKKSLRLRRSKMKTIFIPGLFIFLIFRVSRAGTRLNKIFRYLSHLSISCIVYFCLPFYDKIIVPSGFLKPTKINFLHNQIKKKIIIEHASLSETENKFILDREAECLGTINRSNSSSSWLIAWQNWAFGNCKFVMVPSLLVKGTLIKHGADANNIIINAFEKLELTGEKRRCVADTSETINVLMAGGGVIGKGFHRIFNAVDESGFKMNISLAGSYPSDPMLQKAYSSFFTGKRSNYLGHLTSENLFEEMRKAHIFIHPSLTDGYGMVVAQALMNNCLVMVSKYTGAAEIIPSEDYGMVFDPLSGTSTVKCLSQIIRKIHQGYVIPRLKCSQAEYVKNYLSVLES